MMTIGELKQRRQQRLSMSREEFDREKRVLKQSLKRAVSNGLPWPKKHSGNYQGLDRDSFVRETVFSVMHGEQRDPFEWSLYTVTRDESHNAAPFPLVFFTRNFSETFFGDGWEEKRWELVRSDDPITVLERYL